MAKTDKDGNWTDVRGYLVPPAIIPEIDQRRDALVEKLIKENKKKNAMLAEFRKVCAKSIDEYLAFHAKSKKVRESWRGNIQLKSFDESLLIERAMSDRIDFNENLQLAKAQIDVWLKNRIGGTDPSLAKIISQAFNVDKKGCINTAVILKLMRLEIEDGDWKKAMKILRDSITVASTKLYIRFKEKVQGEGGEVWRNISLDFADAGE
jgi:hypothetical protein